MYAMEFISFSERLMTQSQHLRDKNWTQTTHIGEYEKWVYVYDNLNFIMISHYEW